MKVINFDLPNIQQIGNVKIGTRNGILFFSLDDKYFLENNTNYIYGFHHRLRELKFNSVLIGGLALGMVPYYLKNEKKLSDIDVVEINENNIQLINELGYLKDVNIINDDVRTHKTSKKYDLIIIDTIWEYDAEAYKDIKADIISNYAENLNEGGKIYFTITQEVI